MQLNVLHVIIIIKKTQNKFDRQIKQISRKRGHYTYNNTCQNYPTQKIPEKKFQTQRRSFDPPYHLKSRVPPWGIDLAIKIPYQLGSCCFVASNQDSKNTELCRLVV